jgi:hypothetical protein
MDEQALGFLLLIVVLVGLPAYFLARGRWNLRITVRDGTIDIAGQALQAKSVPVRNFWKEQLSDVRRARVEGRWDGRRLQLRFDGDLSPGQQQRIRNYLLTIL